MIKIALFLFILVNFTFASLIGANYNQRDLQILEDLDIKSSFITDYKLQKTYENLLREHNQNHYVKKLTDASLFVPNIKKILRDEKVPAVFLYMAMAESDFTIDAKSNVKAMGIWQFMYGTGKHYDLDINLYVDERMDLVKSTKAAATYLKHLHKRFGKWYLAAIAYNCGEGRVIEGLTRATIDKYVEEHPKQKYSKKIQEFRRIIYYYQRGSEPFYKLRRVYNEVKKWGVSLDIDELLEVQNKVSRQYVPSESRMYIRKIIALGMMNNQSFITENNNAHLLNIGATSSVATISVKGGLHLRSISNAVGIDYAELKNLNRHLKLQIVPPYVKKYDIYIPYSRLARYQANKDLIKDSRYLVYVVKRGDSLHRIGNKYHVSYKVIKDFNKLHSNLLSLKQKLIIPITTSAKTSSQRLVLTNKKIVRKTSVVYKVKNGDTLYSIARRYKIDLKKLMSDNKLESNFINIGDKIVIKK
ncbi:lytic transglycosylase [Arcobacter sp. CECT 8986]|uniref:lytic transglycosylase domain-containing protein n=1 Tax=Arcobacter sp. CECT 8986 TaxID=2044507 RepID=UPI001009E487|nr:lytic transglycosylase domain-containing protein [Arcobacter sp. CECT 8986]RXK01070.1 lytic transglycosylase [Arcobacter sp. CECT 8986]